MKFLVLALLAGVAVVAPAQTVSCKASLKTTQPQLLATRGPLTYCVEMTNITSKTVRVRTGLRLVKESSPDSATDLPPGQKATVCRVPQSVNGQTDYNLNFKTLLLAFDNLPPANANTFVYFIYGCTAK